MSAHIAKNCRVLGRFRDMAALTNRDGADMNRRRSGERLHDGVNEGGRDFGSVHDAVEEPRLGFEVF